MGRNRVLWGVVVPASVLACVGPPAEPVFEEIATRVGLDFVHFNGMAGEFYFIESMSGGVALFDYDGDGDLDLYQVQGHMLGETSSVDDYPIGMVPDGLFVDRLFRNELEEEGELRFSDVTGEAGIEAGGYGMGVAVGDYDNDGCQDIYVLNWGPNQLWRNRCDGTFEEVATQANVSDERWSVAATFFDYDRDGWLDLYVVNYKDYSVDRDPKCWNQRKEREYCGPVHFKSMADGLYRNRGDSTFEDVSEESLLGDPVGAGLGVVASDLDCDGWIDLYVTNDLETNFLWRNRRDGSLQDVAMLTGTGVDGRGEPLASMGVDVGDYDGNGHPDLFMTHLDGQPNVLYKNLGNGVFEDVSAAVGLAKPSWTSTGFGTVFLDYDNDGMLDIIVANGAIQTLPELREKGDPFPLHQPNQLFRNLGTGRFADVTKNSGSALRLSEVSRGAASGDIDNDGDTDIIVANNAGPTRLLRNRVGNKNPWLGLKLVMGNPHRVAAGARVRLDRRAARPLWRQVRVNGSYGSGNDSRILIGLGDAAVVERVHVEWPDGARESFPAPSLNRYTVLRRGTGTVSIAGNGLAEVSPSHVTGSLCEENSGGMEGDGDE